MMTDEKIVDSAIDLLNKSSLSGYRISKDTGFSEATIGLWRRGIKRPTLKNANQIIGYLNGISPDVVISKMEIKERLDMITNYLGINLKQLSEKCGYERPQAIYDLYNGKTKSISPVVCSKILSAFPTINKFWLLTGDGDMVISKMEKGIPYFTSSEFFECGIPKGINLSLNSNDVKGYASLPEIESSPDMFMVKAHGRSMLNHKLVDYSIPDGAWVVLKKVNSNTVQWGEVYGIATADGFIIKKVMPSEQEGFIKCVSFNVEEDYLPFELPVVDVYDMAKLIAVINMQRW